MAEEEHGHRAHQHHRHVGLPRLRRRHQPAVVRRGLGPLPQRRGPIHVVVVVGGGEGGLQVGVRDGEDVGRGLLGAFGFGGGGSCVRGVGGCFAVAVGSCIQSY